jgi:hypothetical protein
VAATHPGKMVVFFRHGPGTGPAGGGFSWTDYNFVVMPGFNDTWVGEQQNIGAFAHEVGHFLGLSHTFAREFGTEAEAASYFTEKKKNPLVFDGDGLTDTPPDPYVRALQSLADVKSITLRGVTFTLPRGDIMSYYADPRLMLTRQQILRIHETLRSHPQRRTLVLTR